jgi:nucleoside-diphosphate-sugar epimerase
VILSFRLKTVFLTGATGFVGSHAASRFLAAGWRVRALVRRPDRPGLLPSGVEAIPGDLTTIPVAAIEGADAVVHVAGITTATSRNGFFDVNARGTETLARAAAAASPSAKFVLVSSQSAAGPSRDGRPIAESDPPRPVSWYGESKLEGERALERIWKGSWTIVRPSVVYGSGDPGMLQLFAVIARGWAPVLAGGACRIQLIGAGDLARVLLGAADDRGLSGRRGFAAGPAVTTRELALFAGSLRRPAARMLPIPAFAIRAAGVLESVREAITRKSRPFNRDKAREILQPDWVCDAEPFLRDVGIEDLRPWKEGIAETLAWYQREGWLHASFREL